jgi:hypothetical protein
MATPIERFLMGAQEKTRFPKEETGLEDSQIYIVSVRRHAHYINLRVLPGDEIDQDQVLFTIGKRTEWKRVAQSNPAHVEQRDSKWGG